MRLRAHKRKTQFVLTDDLFLNVVAHYTFATANRSSSVGAPQLLHRATSDHRLDTQRGASRFAFRLECFFLHKCNETGSATLSNSRTLVFRSSAKNFTLDSTLRRVRRGYAAGGGNVLHSLEASNCERRSEFGKGDRLRTSRSGRDSASLPIDPMTRSLPGINAAWPPL